MANVRARNWDSLLRLDEISIDRIFAEGLCAHAAQQATADDPDVDVDIDDAMSVWRQACSGEPPDWWPGNLNRLAVRVSATPDDQNPVHWPEQSFHCNGKTLGHSRFVAALGRICRSIGTPFHGDLSIELVTSGEQQWVSGWRGHVEVDIASTTVATAPEGMDGQLPEAMRWVLGHADTVYAGQRQMFGQSASVIHASAAAISALRGANMAPPWMKDGEPADDSPAWMKFAVEAFGIASKALSEGQDAAQTVRQIATRPVPSSSRHAPAALQIAGPVDMQGPPAHDYQWDQPQTDDATGFGPQGAYDGFVASESDAVDDAFEQNADPQATYDGDPEPTRSPSLFSSQESSAAPADFDGMEPADVEAALQRYIDANQHRKNELQRMGMGLARRLM